jgi:hypothetical protein
MTDTTTITRTKADAVVRALQGTLQAIREETETEARWHEEKKRRFVEVGSERATGSGIGESFDNLMAELGLPRRPRRVEFRCRVIAIENIDTSATERVTTVDGGTIYPTADTQVMQPVMMAYEMPVPEGLTCLCEDAHRAVSDCAERYFGVARAQSMTFQLAEHGCGGDDCVRHGYRQPNRVPSDTSGLYLTADREVFTYTPPRP